MVTTAVVAEIVVAGLQAATWITLLVLAIFGADWLDPSALADWTALVTILVIAVAYMLGVVIDRLADDLMLWRQSRLWPPRPVDKSAEIEHMRMSILASDNGVARFLDYQRSRMRIVRATLVNLLLLVPAIVWFLLAQADADAIVVIGVVLVILVCVALTARVHSAIEFAYVSRLSEAYRRAERLPETDIAAAICWYRREGRLEFRLVRTKDGAFWTFPKGHQHKGETLPETAAREAKEEAGVEGGIEGRRLLEYSYPASRSGKDEDDMVAAFMLKVESVGPPTEGARGQVWCDVEEASEKLAKGRDLVYAEGMKRVLRAAEREVERSVETSRPSVLRRFAIRTADVLGIRVAARQSGKV